MLDILKKWVKMHEEAYEFMKTKEFYKLPRKEKDKKYREMHIILDEIQRIGKELEEKSVNLEETDFYENRGI